MRQGRSQVNDDQNNDQIWTARQELAEDEPVTQSFKLFHLVSFQPHIRCGHVTKLNQHIVSL
jgi:hypothetical protein